MEGKNFAQLEGETDGGEEPGLQRGGKKRRKADREQDSRRQISSRSFAFIYLFKKKPGRAFFVFFCFFGALLDEERNTGRTLFFKGRCLTLWRLLDIESRAVVDVKSRGRTFGHTAGGMYPSRAAASQRLWRCPACALGIALLLQSVLELSASGESRKNSTPHHSNAQTKTPLISLSISIYLSLYSSMFLPFLGFFLALNWTM